MRLVRFGQPGREHPGIIDSERRDPRSERHRERH